MKGFIVFAFCLFSLGAEASLEKKTARSISIKTHAGKIIRNLSLQESTKVLESLAAGESIELREEIIYPEEISAILVGKLTKRLFPEKRPNPDDY